MKPIIGLLFFVACQIAFGQGFSDKTNAIRIDYTQPIVPATLPSISWIVPRVERSNSIEGSVTLEAEITSETALKSIEIEITNGGTTRTRPMVIGENRNRTSIKQFLKLGDGENTIRLVAVNQSGGKVSSTRSIITGDIPDIVSANRKDYALLLATDQYENFPELGNPIYDARSIESLLKEKYGFITELVENPSLEEINDKIYEYNTKKFNPQDQLFIFVAGHGFFDENVGEGFLIASNSTMNDKGKTSYLSHVLLRSRIDAIKCEHIFLSMDVCFGGTFDEKLAKSRSAEALDEVYDKEYLAKKLTKRTRKFLTSGSKEYVPDGTPGKHSPFAEKFILALKEIGGGTGKILSLTELQTYFLKLSTEPRYGSFGNDDPASDFVFVAK